MTSPSNQELNDNETNFRILSFGPPPPATVRDELDIEEQEEEGRPSPPSMPDSETARDLLRMVLLNEHGRIHASPPESEAQTLNPSPTPTEDDTPGYPFRPFLGEEEDDIPTDVRLRPYLAGQIN